MGTFQLENVKGTRSAPLIGVFSDPTYSTAAPELPQVCRIPHSDSITLFKLTRRPNRPSLQRATARRYYVTTGLGGDKNGF